jgi:hypothetical protein
MEALAIRHEGAPRQGLMARDQGWFPANLYQRLQTAQLRQCMKCARHAGFVFEYKHAGAAITQDVGDVSTGARPVNSYGEGADTHCGKGRDGPLRTVEAEDGHGIAPLHAHCKQGACALADLGGVLRPGGGLPAGVAARPIGGALA